MYTFCHTDCQFLWQIRTHSRYVRTRFGHSVSAGFRASAYKTEAVMASIRGFVAIWPIFENLECKKPAPEGTGYPQTDFCTAATLSTGVRPWPSGSDFRPLGHASALCPVMRHGSVHPCLAYNRLHSTTIAS